MNTNRRFPLCKEEEITFALLSLSSMTVATLNYYPRDSEYVYHTIKGKEIASNYGTDEKQVLHTDRDDDAVEKIIEIYFQTFKDSVDVLQYYIRLPQESEFGRSLNCEHPFALPKLKTAIAGRPLKVTLLMEDHCSWPNGPTSIFIRDYADYSMFICDAHEAIELNDKMVNCEFLGLKCNVTNPERLKEFKGWGLALENAEQKGFDFNFYCCIFESWYMGNKVQFRYLGLELSSVDRNAWQTMCSRGEEKEYSNQIKVIEITREDGNICRIKCMDSNENGKSATKVIFYLGERTLEIDDFNLSFKPNAIVIG